AFEVAERLDAHERMVALHARGHGVERLRRAHRDEQSQQRQRLLDVGHLRDRRDARLEARALAREVSGELFANELVLERRKGVERLWHHRALLEAKELTERLREA